MEENKKVIEMSEIPAENTAAEGQENVPAVQEVKKDLVDRMYEKHVARKQKKLEKQAATEGEPKNNKKTAKIVGGVVAGTVIGGMILKTVLGGGSYSDYELEDDEITDEDDSDSGEDSDGSAE